MPYTVYRSTDPGAPVLNGLSGSLLSVFDACLVTGYGSKAGAGWTKPFSSTNIAVYRNANTALAPSYFRVADNSNTLATCVGYDSMTDVDNGTFPFPSSTQMSSGVYLVKSSSADSTARPWIVLADERTAVMFAAHGGSTWTLHFYMGDGIPVDVTDTSMACLGGNESVSASGHYLTVLYAGGNETFAPRTGIYVKGVDNGLGTASKMLYLAGGPNVQVCTGNMNPSSVGGNLAMPSAGSIWLWPPIVYWYNGQNSEVRGQLRFYYIPRHPPALFTNGDTFSGTGSLSGKSFEILKTVSNAHTSGALAFVTQNPD